MFWVGLLVQWNEKKVLAAETYERISGCFSPKVSAMEMFGRISGCFSRVKWGSLKFSLNGWRKRSKQSQSPRSLQSESAWLKCGHREIIILSKICCTSPNFIYFLTKLLNAGISFHQKSLLSSVTKAGTKIRRFYELIVIFDTLCLTSDMCLAFFISESIKHLKGCWIPCVGYVHAWRNFCI